MTATAPALNMLRTVAGKRSGEMSAFIKLGHVLALVQVRVPIREQVRAGLFLAATAQGR